MFKVLCCTSLIYSSSQSSNCCQSFFFHLQFQINLAVRLVHLVEHWWSTAVSISSVGMWDASVVKSITVVFGRSHVHNTYSGFLHQYRPHNSTKDWAKRQRTQCKLYVQCRSMYNIWHTWIYSRNQKTKPKLFCFYLSTFLVGYIVFIAVFIQKV